MIADGYVCSTLVRSASPKNQRLRWVDGELCSTLVRSASPKNQRFSGLTGIRPIK